MCVESERERERERKMNTTTQTGKHHQDINYIIYLYIKHKVIFYGSLTTVEKKKDFHVKTLVINYLLMPYYF